MKKLLLILCLFSMTAHAEWKDDGGNDDLDSYIDYSRIQTEGRYKSMWALQDFKSPQTNSLGNRFKSSVVKRIVDCQASRSQYVAIYQYSGQMGIGNIVFSETYQIQESKWLYPPPNSIGEGYIKVACGRK